MTYRYIIAVIIIINKNSNDVQIYNSSYNNNYNKNSNDVQIYNSSNNNNYNKNNNDVQIYNSSLINRDKYINR